MSAYDDFYQMANEMLNDPEIRSLVSIHAQVQIENPDKPWEPTFTAVIHDNVSCFYYKPKTGMVNGTVIAKGQKALLLQSPVPEASLLKAKIIDANGKTWNVVTIEEVVLNDKPLYQKVIIGV